MTRSNQLTALLTAVAVLASAAAIGAPAFAADGGGDDAAGPTGIADCGATITEPGRYVVTEDIESGTSGPCVRIATSDVTLDGDGHALSLGVPSTGVLAAGDAEETLTNVTVRDVVVEGQAGAGLSPGIRYEEVTDSAIVNATARGNNVGVALTNVSDAVVRESALIGEAGPSNTPTLFGVLARNATNVAVVDSRIEEMTRAGIRLEEGSDENRIADNCLRSNGVGVSLRGADDNRVESNVIPDAGAAVGVSRGIALEGDAVGNVVAANEIGGASTGVYAAVLGAENGTNAVRGNVIRANVHGVDVAAGSATLAVRGNVIVGAENGIRIRAPAACGPAAEGAESVEIRRNAIANNSAYGVLNEDAEVVNATRNFWGAPSGPSSANDSDAPFVDPVTDDPADGNGDAVSESPENAGVSNVRFDPALTAEPSPAGGGNESDTGA